MPVEHNRASQSESDPLEGIKKLRNSRILEPVARTIIEDSLQLKPGDRLMIFMHPSGWLLAETVRKSIIERNKKIAAEKGIEPKDLKPEERMEVAIRYYHPEMEKILLDGKDYEPEEAANILIRGIGMDRLGDVIWANRFLIIRNKIESGKFDISEDVEKQRKAVESALLRIRNGNPKNAFVLIYQPDKVEAKLAEMSLPQYKRAYYEAIDRPWGEVEKAHQVLINFLKGKDMFEISSPTPNGFPADWETKITMSIKGMVGRSSTIKNNLPGSEVFLAPVLDSVEGTYAIPYPVMMENRILPNLKLVFKEGKVVSHDIYFADPNDPQRALDLKFVQSMLDTDDGFKRIGELGIGTNPKVKKAYLNTLLVEKGAVHLALGNAYKNDANSIIDNGNKSKFHVDLARVLLPEYGGGTLTVDGEVLQRDGKFLIPGLEVLNGD